MTTPDVKPSQLLHCESVYTKMREQAREVREQDVPMFVWEGYLTKLVRELGLSVPYYSTVKGHLEKMGCMRQLRRGGGNAMSQWELIKPPTMKLWEESGTNKVTTPRAVVGADPAAVATAQQQVRDLTVRVEALEGNVETLVGMFNKMLDEGKK
jgi:hypothetical protein